MLSAISYVIACIIGIVVLFIYRNSKLKTPEKRQNRSKNIPGPPRSDPITGNANDIAAAGGMHTYLSRVHRKYGPVVQIWLGEELVISTASTEAFKDQMKIFDKPPMTFLSPVFGSHSIHFVNGDEAKRRRQAYDEFMKTRFVEAYFPTFSQIIEDMCSKWDLLRPVTEVPVYRYMFNISCKAVGVTLFGDYFKDDNNVEHFRKLYEYFWPLLERNFTVGLPQEGTKEKTEFDKVVQKVHTVVKEIMDNDSSHRNLTKAILETGIDDVTVLGDILTYLVGGFHSTSITLTWCLYYASRYPNVQKKLYEEVKAVMDDGHLALEDIPKLRYLKQFINEVLRIRYMAPVTQRMAGPDTTVCGYAIPAGTWMMQALGVVMNNTNLSKNPDVFNPDRFSPENAKGRPPLAFCPFGFAGRRMCPGEKYFRDEAMIYLAYLFDRYKFVLVDPQEEIGIIYGLLTRPDRDINVKIRRRPQQ